MTTFHIITLFPDSLTSYLQESMIARAQATKKIRIKFYNPRDFAVDRREVDDKPYGGGPGMVIKAEPVLKAVAKAVTGKKKVKIYLFSPRGKNFTNDLGRKVAKQYSDIVLICGRYEGIDARVKKILKAEAVSIGPYILTGGELPALVVLDVVARQIKGVLGKNESLEENRSTNGEVYTRPEIFEYKKKKYQVPKVLLSGDHKKIDEWRASE